MVCVFVCVLSRLLACSIHIIIHAQSPHFACVVAGGRRKSSETTDVIRTECEHKHAHIHPQPLEICRKTKQNMKQELSRVHI